MRLNRKRSGSRAWARWNAKKVVCGWPDRGWPLALEITKDGESPNGAIHDVD